MMRFSFSGRGSSFLLTGLGGLFILISLTLLIFFLNDFSQLQKYQAGHCTITAKQLLQREEQETHTSNGHKYITTTTVYTPNFEFTVWATDNHRYQAQGYDALGTSSSDRSSQQAILNQYTVGKTYPCWYDPANPTNAVLTRQFNLFVFFIPALFFFIGAVFAIFGIALIRKRI